MSISSPNTKDPSDYPFKIDCPECGNVFVYMKKRLKKGDIIYHSDFLNGDGTEPKLRDEIKCSFCALPGRYGFHNPSIVDNPEYINHKDLEPSIYSDNIQLSDIGIDEWEFNERMKGGL